VVFAGFAAIAFIWYFAYARKNFKGPPVALEPVKGVIMDISEKGIK
jgi:hypothetical protein